MDLQDKLTSPFVIDSQTFPNVRIMSITRNFSVLDGKEAERTMAGDMVRDIIGTYYNYTAKFRCKLEHETEYNNLYWLLSAPVDYHTISLPFANKTITQKMYVTGGSDNLKRFKTDGENWFYEMQINFVAMSAFRLAGET